MKVIFADRQQLHDPVMFYSSGARVPHPEKPERAARLLAAAERAGLDRETPDDVGLDTVAALHSARYLSFLENIYPRWRRIDGASDEVWPGIHPDSRSGGYPKSATGQAGFHQWDLSVPIGEHTWQAALSAAHSAVHAATLVVAGERSSYALCRPPGHHATREFAAGFCYLGNTAAAALKLRSRHAKVAVLDVDVHHGNGTQDLFYTRDDVLTVSIHADPIRFFPFFWGYANETGEASGRGFNLNIPLARGTDDDAYLPELEWALTAIDDFGADALVVALGLDAFEGDPFQGFRITTGGFGRIGERIGALDRPTVLVQEGGYLTDELGDNLRSFLEGFMRSHGE